MEDEDPIIRNVSMRMAAKGLGPKALSLRAGLNETYVRDLLKGRSRNPRQAHLQKLANALECEVGDLTSATLVDQNRLDLLAAYDAMDEAQRQALLTMAKGVVRRDPEPEPQRPATRPRRAACVTSITERKSWRA